MVFFANVWSFIPLAPLENFLLTLLLNSAIFRSFLLPPPPRNFSANALVVLKLFLIYNQKYCYASLLNKLYEVFACARASESCT